jgi:predicted CoA-binding protein
MTWQQLSDSELSTILIESKDIAVIGASGDSSKPSFMVLNYLKENTPFNLFPVNPREESISGVKVFKSLEEIPSKIDICVVFRRPEFMPEVLVDVIAKESKVLWMQLGIENHEVAELAIQSGILVVQNRCIKIEYARLIQGKVLNQ